MPAETHSHLDGVDETTVLDALTTVIGLEEPPPLDAPLDAIGISDDLALVHLWEDVAEELAERTVAELEVDIADLESVGDLVAAILEVVSPR